jgi:hypothetical protein
MNRCATATLAFTLTFLAGTARLSAQAAMAPGSLDSVRAALDKYKDPIVAVRDGYFSTVACVDFPNGGHAGETAYPAGAMGVHLLNLGAIGPQPDAARPTVLIYEPHGDTLRLVAAEWFVPTQVTKERPQLFGRPFDGPMAGHEPIMPAALEHWDLHVWLWRTNPAGMYTPTNAAVTCPRSVNTVHLSEEHHAH